mmetsp:Transcript_553/g.772  ORF Transcript_553/g.772 Transcript_553/m.772 type:complete len:80 (+) Transcript_553:95-334(+)
MHESTNQEILEGRVLLKLFKSYKKILEENFDLRMCKYRLACQKLEIPHSLELLQLNNAVAESFGRVKTALKVKQDFSAR